MTIGSTIEADFHAIGTGLANLFTKLTSSNEVQTVETDVKAGVADIEQWLQDNAYPEIIQDAGEFLASAASGTSFPTLVEQFAEKVVSQGKALLAGAAHVAINLAQSSLIAANPTVAITTVTTSTPAVNAVTVTAQPAVAGNAVTGPAEAASPATAPTVAQ